MGATSATYFRNALAQGAAEKCCEQSVASDSGEVLHNVRGDPSRQFDICEVYGVMYVRAITDHTLRSVLDEVIYTELHATNVPVCLHGSTWARSA